MGRYAIDKSFKRISCFRPPFVKWAMPISRRITGKMWRILLLDFKIHFSKHYIPTTGGGAGIEVDIIEPKKSPKETLPCIFMVHGGGFAYDANRHHYALAARYAKELKCKVVMPRYRLSPKNVFPSQLDDCRLAWSWIMTNSELLGIDTERTGIVGDSSGGFIAAFLTNLLATKEKYIPAFTQLIYPVIDPKMRSESMHMPLYTSVWNPSCNRRMWRWVLKDYTDVSSLDLPDFPVPPDLPETYIETAEFDCLRDEGKAWAEKLSASGVDVTLNETKGTVHGYDMVSCKITEEAIAKRMAFIRRKFQEIQKQQYGFGGTTNEQS